MLINIVGLGSRYCIRYFISFFNKIYVKYKICNVIISVMFIWVLCVFLIYECYLF